MNNRIVRLLKYFLGWPISAISLFFILRIIVMKSSSIVTYLKNINVYFILIGIFFFLGYYFIRGFLWQKMLSLKNYNFRLKNITYLWGVTEFKRYTPGNIWSFVARGLSMSKAGVERKDIINFFLLEVKLIILSSLILTIFALAWIFDLFPKYFHQQFLELLVIAIIILLNIVFIFSQRLKSKIKFLSFLFSDFSAISNFNLLAISTLSMFCFGLGSYFVAISVTPLMLSHIIVFSGLFVFSLLIGYLSIITPMGLGVREGIVIWFLLPIMRLNLAAAVSIITRIFLILSELIFLGLIYLWVNLKNKIFYKTEAFISKHRYEVGLGILILIYVIYFTAASFLRFDNFYAGRFDLGNMDQVVWNTIHGRIFQLTDPNGTNIVSRLMFHADFLLVLISPFYLIWSNPKMLLLLQTLVLGAGAIFTFLLGKDLLKNKKVSLLISFAYLMFPALQYSNLYDFHAVTLVTTFLLGAFYFIKNKKYFWFTVFLILAALTKEEIWIIAFLFGIYVLFLNLRKKTKNVSVFGLIVSILSLLIFYILIWVAIPLIRGSGHFALSYYSDFGGSPAGIIRNVLFSPVKTLSIILQPKRLEFLYQILFPTGFLVVFAPFYMIFAFPELLINMLSNNPQLYQIYYQYTAALTPFIFISSIYSIRYLGRKIPSIPINFFFWYLLFTTLFSAYLLGPLPGARNPNIDMFTRQLANRTVIDDFISKIPPRYSIAATNNLGAHMSHRQEIYTIPVGVNQADIVLFLLNDPSAQPSLFAQREMVKNMTKDSKYIEIFKNGDFVVFEKKNLFVEKKPRASTNRLFPYAIDALSSREYKGSQINIENKVSSSGSFATYLISYLSDGLKIYGTMNIPTTQKPDKGFPVVILNHGYINPATYNNLTDYSQIQNFFASQGYIVIKPDYRGNGNSDGFGEPLNRFAYPIDVLNLIVSLKNIPEANPNQAYIWGHSMGGEVSLEVLEVASKIPDINGKIKAATLWAPVTDPIKWFSASHIPQIPEALITPFPYQQTFQIMGTPNTNSPIWQSISPLQYLSNINVPVQLQHGTADQTVPYSWDQELYNDLTKLNKKSNLILYPNNDHNLVLSQQQALNDSLNYFKQY